MFFWGCDVRHPEGSLLSRVGMDRLARSERSEEGSSRYRMEWRNGLVELHSYCVGWYASDAPVPGILFIRSLERITSCVGPLPLTPGKYEQKRMISEGADDLLQSVKPLVSWILFYETQVGRLAGSTYRGDCWRRYLSRMGSRPWLPPGEAESFFQSFLEDPKRTPRPRDFFRSTRPHRSPAGLKKRDRHFSF